MRGAVENEKGRLKSLSSCDWQPVVLDLPAPQTAHRPGLAGTAGTTITGGLEANDGPLEVLAPFAAARDAALKLLPMSGPFWSDAGLRLRQPVAWSQLCVGQYHEPVFHRGAFRWLQAIWNRS